MAKTDKGAFIKHFNMFILIFTSISLSDMKNWCCTTCVAWIKDKIRKRDKHMSSCAIIPAC